jgi:hypothetical protein
VPVVSTADSATDSLLLHQLSPLPVSAIQPA